MRSAARLSSLFVLGAVLGTAGDQLHVRSGVLSYARPSPLLFGQALWVPLLFGAAGVLLVLGHAPLLRLTRERSARASAFGFAAAVLWFYGAYASTALFAGARLALTAALVAAWVARVAAAPAADKVLAGVLWAIAGPLFEAALSATGAFQYRRPDVLLVPAWLPALYLHVSLMTREAYLVFFGARREAVEATAPDRR
ncbi:MAG TPA: hypothetical protein VIV57_23410 [Anaeromyxobacter sp.]